MIEEPMNLLLVEDNLGDVELTREAFRDASVRNEIHVARDGIECLDFLRRKEGYESAPRPDLILLDLNLPRMDGREVLAEIKNDENLQSIPVVIMSSSDAQRDVSQTYRMHGNCYVTKPVDLERFMWVVKVIESFWFAVARLPSRPTSCEPSATRTT